MSEVRLVPPEQLARLAAGLRRDGFSCSTSAPFECSEGTVAYQLRKSRRTLRGWAEIGRGPPKHKALDGGVFYLLGEVEAWRRRNLALPTDEAA